MRRPLEPHPAGVLSKYLEIQKICVLFHHLFPMVKTQDVFKWPWHSGAISHPGRSCPVNRLTRFTEKISTAACAVDVSVVLTSFTRHQDSLRFHKGNPMGFQREIVYKRWVVQSYYKLLDLGSCIFGLDRFSGGITVLSVHWYESNLGYPKTDGWYCSTMVFIVILNHPTIDNYWFIPPKNTTRAKSSVFWDPKRSRLS